MKRCRNFRQSQIWFEKLWYKLVSSLNLFFFIVDHILVCLHSLHFYYYTYLHFTLANYLTSLLLGCAVAVAATATVVVVIFVANILLLEEHLLNQIQIGLLIKNININNSNNNNDTYVCVCVCAEMWLTRFVISIRYIRTNGLWQQL